MPYRLSVGTRREFEKGGKGMKGRVDNSMGIVITHIVEDLDRIKPTESLRLDK
jgi:hypothetical protein